MRPTVADRITAESLKTPLQLVNTEDFLDRSSFSQEMKNEAIKVAEAVAYLGLGYSNESYSVYSKPDNISNSEPCENNLAYLDSVIAAVTNLITKSLSETDFPEEYKEAGKCLIEACRILESEEKEFVVNGSDILQRVIEVSNAGRVAYLVVRYQINNTEATFRPIELSYINGNRFVAPTGEGKSCYGAITYRIDADKLDRRTLEDPEEFEAYLLNNFNMQVLQNRDQGSSYIDKVKDFLHIMVAKSSSGHPILINSKLLIADPTNGDRSFENIGLLLRYIAAEFYDALFLEEIANLSFTSALEFDKENKIKEAYKFYRKLTIEKAIDTLVNFITIQQNLREADPISYTVHPFFDQALQGLQRSFEKSISEADMQLIEKMTPTLLREFPEKSFLEPSKQEMFAHQIDLEEKENLNDEKIEETSSTPSSSLVPEFFAQLCENVEYREDGESFSFFGGNGPSGSGSGR